MIELVAFWRAIFASREVKTSSKDRMSLRVLEKGAPMHSVLHFERSEPIEHSRLEHGLHMHEQVWAPLFVKNAWLLVPKTGAMVSYWQ